MLGHHLYFTVGPPGTGKSSSLGRYLQREAEAIGSRWCAACSFTRAAAVRLAEVANLPKENVGTLHSFAYRALGNPTLTVKNVKSWNEAQGAWRLSGGAVDADNPYEDRVQGDTMGDALLAEIDINRARCLPVERWRSSLLPFWAAWCDWKKQEDLLDFTDLLEVCLRDVEQMPGEPLVCVVDECQDCSALQLALLVKWSQRMRKMVLTGDDSQNLYAWAGADHDAIIDLANQLPLERRFTLAQSYRVPAKVHALSEAWIARSRKRYQREYRPRNVEGTIRRHHGDWKRPDDIVRDAERQAAAGRKVMILASCSYMLGPTLATLRQAAIPFHNPYRLLRRDWNPLTPGDGKSVTAVDRVLALLRPDPDTWGDAARDWSKDEVSRWLACLKSEGTLVRGCKEWLKELKGKSDPLHTFELLSWVETKALDDFDQVRFVSPEDTQRTLQWFLDRCGAEDRRKLEYPARVASKRGGKTLLEEPRICVGTGHSVKGGEAEVVYLLPDLSQAAALEWQDGAGDAVRRLFYVMMTRTSDELVLCQPATRSFVNI